MEPEVAAARGWFHHGTLSALLLGTQPLSGPGCRGNNYPVAAFPRPDSQAPLDSLDGPKVDKLLWRQLQGSPLESTIG